MSKGEVLVHQRNRCGQGCPRYFGSLARNLKIFLKKQELERLLCGWTRILYHFAICIVLVSCQPRVDVTGAAHPVHVDPFMAKKLEAQLIDLRNGKDELFRTSQDSPLPPEVRLFFKGLEYYPINWKYRFEGPVVRYPDPPKIKMIDTEGEKRDGIKFGTLRLNVDGKDYTLQVYQLQELAEKNMLFIPFTDANTGKETYPAGRYLDLKEKDNGLYVIDFNEAYNPYCAYGSRYACPITPVENHLPLPIPAGEKILPLAAKLEPQ